MALRMATKRGQLVMVGTCLVATLDLQFRLDHALDERQICPQVRRRCDHHKRMEVMTGRPRHPRNKPRTTVRVLLLR